MLTRRSEQSLQEFDPLRFRREPEFYAGMSRETFERLLAAGELPEGIGTYEEVVEWVRLRLDPELQRR